MLVSPRLYLLLVALLATTTTTLAQDARERGKRKKKMSFGVAKGFKCSGYAECGKGMEKECEGGMQQNFTAHAHSLDILEELTEGIHDAISHDLMPSAEEFMPDDEMMQGMIEHAILQEELTERENMQLDQESELAMTKTWEFGGTTNMEWGCKVTYAMKHGELSKETECGFKASFKSGKKPNGGEEEEQDASTM